MVNYPDDFDTDAQIPRVDDNVTEVSAESLNAMRTAIFAIQNAIGLNPEGSTASLVTRLSESLNDDGTLKASALLAAGLVALPVTNSMIGASAAIEESKLDLDVATQLLQDQIDSNDIDIAALQEAVADLLNKFNRHVAGLGFRHTTAHIDLATSLTSVVASNLDDALVVINDRYLDHVDSAKVGAHTASNISVDTTGFQVINPGSVDVQRSLEDLDRAREILMENHRDDMHANGFGNWANDQDGYSLYKQKYPVLVTEPALGAVVTGTRNAFEFDGYALLGYNVKQGDILVIENSGIAGQYVIDDVGPRNAVGTKPSLASDQLEIIGTFADGYAAQSVRALIYGQSSVDNIKTNCSPTIRQSDIRVDSIQIARPRAAKVLSLGIQPNLIDSTHTLDIEVGVGTGTGTRTITVDNLNFNRLGSPATEVTVETVVERINDVLQNRTDGYAFPAAAYQVGAELMLSHNWIGNSDIYFKVLNTGTGNFVLGLDGYGADVVDRNAYPVQTNYFWVGGKRYSDVAEILNTTADVTSTVFTMPAGVNPLTAGVKRGHLLHLKTHTNTSEVGTYFITDVTSTTITIAKTSGITADTDVQIEIYHDALPLDDFSTNLRNQIAEAYLTSQATLGYNERVSYTDNINNVSIVNISDNFLPVDDLPLQTTSSGSSTTFTLGTGLPVTIPNTFVGELKVYAGSNIEFVVLNISGVPGIGTNEINIYEHIDEEEYLEVCSVNIDGALTIGSLSDKRLFGSIGLDEIREDVVQVYVETPWDELRASGVVRGFDMLRDIDGDIFGDGYFDPSLYPTNQGLVFRGGTAYVGGARCDLITTPVPFPNTAGTYTVVLNALGTFKILNADDYSFAEILDGYAGSVIPMAHVVHNGSIITSAEDRRFFINKLDDKVELLVDVTNRMIGTFATIEAAVGWLESYPYQEKFKLRYVSNKSTDLTLPSSSRDITLVLDGKVSNLNINTSCRLISESLSNRGFNHVDGYLTIGGDCIELEADNLSLSSVNLVPGSSSCRFTFRNCYFDGYGSGVAEIDHVSGTYSEYNFFGCTFGTNSHLDLSGTASGSQNITNCVFAPGFSNSDYYQVGIGGFISRVTNCRFNLAGLNITGSSFGDKLVDSCLFQNMTPDASLANVAISGGSGNGPVILNNCTFNAISTSGNGETFINLQSTEENIVSNCKFLGGSIAAGDQLMNVAGTVSNCSFDTFGLPTTQSITCDKFYDNHATGGSGYLIGTREFVNNTGFGSVTSMTASEELRVVANNIFENGSQGFNVDLTALDAGDACSVVGNHFSVSGATAMTCVTFPSANIQVAVSNNTFDGDSDDIALALVGVTGVIVSGNEFTSLDAFSTTGQIDRCIFVGNRFEDSTFSIQIGDENIFTDNVLYEGTQAFTGASGSTGLLVSNNIFGTNTTFTMSQTTLANASISGNTFNVFNLNLGSSITDSVISQNIGVMDSSTTFTASNCAYSFNMIDYSSINNVTWNNSFISNNVFTHTTDTDFTLTSSGGGVDANVLIQENVFNSTGSSAVQVSSTNPVRSFYISQNINGSGSEATMLFNSQINQTVVEGNLNFNINVANGSSSSTVADNIMPNDQLTFGGTCNSTLITNNFLSVIMANCASTTGLVIDGNYISDTLDILSGLASSTSISRANIINNFIVNGITIFDSPVGDGYNMQFKTSFIANNTVTTGGIEAGDNALTVGNNYTFNFSDVIIQGNELSSNSISVMDWGTIGTSATCDLDGLRIIGNKCGNIFMLGSNIWDSGSNLSNVRIDNNNLNTFAILADGYTEAVLEEFFITNNALIGEGDSTISGVRFSNLVISGNSIEGSFGDLEVELTNSISETDGGGNEVVSYSNLIITNNITAANVELKMVGVELLIGTPAFVALEGFRFFGNSMSGEKGLDITTETSDITYYMKRVNISSNTFKYCVIDQNAGGLELGDLIVNNNVFTGENGTGVPNDPGFYANNNTADRGLIWLGGSFSGNVANTLFDPVTGYTVSEPQAIFYILCNSENVVGTIISGMSMVGNAGLTLYMESDANATGRAVLQESSISNNTRFAIYMESAAVGDEAILRRCTINANHFVENDEYNGASGTSFEGIGSGTIEFTDCGISNNVISISDWDLSLVVFDGDGIISGNMGSSTNFTFDPSIWTGTPQVKFIGNHFNQFETVGAYTSAGNSDTFWWGNTGEAAPTNLTVSGTTAVNVTTANNMSGNIVN